MLFVTTYMAFSQQSFFVVGTVGEKNWLVNK
jgi:hypothetical protein